MQPSTPLFLSLKNKTKCKRCNKDIDLEHGAYFSREVWNDPEDTTKGIFRAFTCIDCIISDKRGFW